MAKLGIVLQAGSREESEFRRAGGAIGFFSRRIESESDILNLSVGMRAPRPHT
jgi:hypothetical protein